MAQNPLQQNILIAFQEVMPKIQSNDWMILRELPQQTNIIMNTSFKSLVATFKALLLLGSYKKPILISNWHMELERRTQGPGEVVTKYAKAIKKLIKWVDSRRN
ncbi:hypothetical protein G9A89_005436 [Geosiphon pyriformis]|nr:hypothetical protein G9A89_005436 [Geosiphon pyriformis]